MDIGLLYPNVLHPSVDELFFWGRERIETVSGGVGLISKRVEKMLNQGVITNSESMKEEGEDVN